MFRSICCPNMGKLRKKNLQVPILITILKIYDLLCLHVSSTTIFKLSNIKKKLWQRWDNKEQVVMIHMTNVTKTLLNGLDMKSLKLANILATLSRIGILLASRLSVYLQSASGHSGHCFQVHVEGVVNSQTSNESMFRFKIKNPKKMHKSFNGECHPST